MKNKKKDNAPFLDEVDPSSLDDSNSIGNDQISPQIEGGNARRNPRLIERQHVQDIIDRKNESRNNQYIQEKADAAGLPPEATRPNKTRTPNYDNFQPDAVTKFKKPSPPVSRSALGLVYPDGGGMGPLPPLRSNRLGKMAKDLRNSVAQPTEAARRMAICRSCPELMSMDRCRRCGCFMQAKTKIGFAQCPLQKW